MREASHVRCLEHKAVRQFAGERKVQHVGIRRLQFVVQTPRDREPAAGQAGRRCYGERTAGRWLLNGAWRHRTVAACSSAAGWYGVERRKTGGGVDGLNTGGIGDRGG